MRHQYIEPALATWLVNDCGEHEREKDGRTTGECGEETHSHNTPTNHAAPLKLLTLSACVSHDEGKSETRTTK